MPGKFHGRSWETMIARLYFSASPGTAAAAGPEADERHSSDIVDQGEMSWQSNRFRIVITTGA